MFLDYLILMQVLLDTYAILEVDGTSKKKGTCACLACSCQAHSAEAVLSHAGL